MRLGCSRSVFRVAAKPPSGRLKPRSEALTSGQLLESISLNFRHGLETGFEEISLFGLLQLHVFGFGRDENGDVRVGVFPERKEILICGSGFGASPAMA